MLKNGRAGVGIKRYDAFLFGTAVVDVERGQFSETKSYPWQTDTAVALNSWCYTEGNRYKQASDILCDLMDIVKNGNLLLNIGPRADGTIPQEDASILREIGDWLRTNGEAVYCARPWKKKFGEGPTQVADGQFSDSVKRNSTSADIHGEWRRALCRCSQGGSSGRIPFYPAERAGEICSSAG